MQYNKPFDQTNPAAGYVNGNPATNTAGSIPCAEGLEYPQREIVAAIVAAGLTPTNADLTQLTQAISVIASGAATTKILFQAQPIFPEISGAANAFTFSTVNGQISINTGQAWQHRGGVNYSTNLFSAGQLAFATAASKIYHIVWDAPGTGLATPKATYPQGLFSLIDRTGASPPETDVSYDSTYDRMLCARVATDASNNPTFTALANKQLLSATLTDSVTGGTSSVAAGKTQPVPTDNPRIIFDTRSPANGGDGAGRAASAWNYNWARTPKISPATVYVGYTGQSANASVPYTYQEGGSRVTSKIVTRYAAVLQYQTDYNLAGIADTNGNLILTGMLAGASLDISANG